MPDPEMTEADILGRIENARRELIKRKFRCLSAGPFGLPSYSDVEAWANGVLVVYLLYDKKTGGWDILSQIDRTNQIVETYKALDALTIAANRPGR